MRPVGIDLFAGAGGLSLGFEQAGFDVVAAVEIDPIHAAVHQFNFPNCAVLPRSISDITGADLRSAGGIGKKNIDVVFGGAPCQGFSLIGQRAFDDPRNSLVSEFVRIVSELNPSYFVFENVKGLTIGKQREFLDDLIETFSRMGYTIKLPWKVLDSADFGVPQHRERLILFGAREGLTLPDYPMASTTPADRASLEFLPCGPTCQDALGDLPDADSFHSLLDTDEVKISRWQEPTDYASEMRSQFRGAWHYGYVRQWDRDCLTSSTRTDHTESSRKRFAETAPGDVERISRFFKLSPDGLCNTLRAGTDSARGAFTSPRPIHYRYPRCITVREMARLHGYPDWFRFHKTKWHGARQIGNSVPPPLARAVAKQVIAALAIQPASPQETLSLGDDALLSMTMSEAAEHYGIVVPITPRNRKGILKKRKQYEIEEQKNSREAVVA